MRVRSHSGSRSHWRRPQVPASAYRAMAGVVPTTTYRGRQTFHKMSYECKPPGILPRRLRATVAWMGFTARAAQPSRRATSPRWQLDGQHDWSHPQHDDLHEWPQQPYDWDQKHHDWYQHGSNGNRQRSGLEQKRSDLYENVR